VLENVCIKSVETRHLFHLTSYSEYTCVYYCMQPCMTVCIAVLNNVWWICKLLSRGWNSVGYCKIGMLKGNIVFVFLREVVRACVSFLCYCCLSVQAFCILCLHLLLSISRCHVFIMIIHCVNVQQFVVNYVDCVCVALTVNAWLILYLLHGTTFINASSDSSRLHCWPMYQHSAVQFMFV